MFNIKIAKMNGTSIYDNLCEDYASVANKGDLIIIDDLCVRVLEKVWKIDDQELVLIVKEDALNLVPSSENLNQ